VVREGLYQPPPAGESGCRIPPGQQAARPDAADVPLDLQALADQCYHNGACDGTLDYAADPDPPLPGADREWAAEWLQEKGLRPRKRPPRRKGRPRAR